MPANLIIAALIAVGCGATRLAPKASVNGSVTTNRSEYRQQKGTVDVIVSYRNDADSSRYLGRCGHDVETLIERLEGGTWTPLQLWWCPAVLGPPVSVAPRETRSRTVTLRPGPLVGAARLIGTFRIRLVAYSNVDERGFASGTPLDATQTTSPAFSVRE